MSKYDKQKSIKNDTQGRLWEVFTQSRNGKPFEHAGSLHAPDAEKALENARDVYTRRSEATQLWIVPSEEIISSQPEDAESFFDPADDKPYRHPQFYHPPRSVKKRS